MNNIVINNVTYHVPVMCCEMSIAQSQLITELHKTLKTKEQTLNGKQSRRVLTEICGIDKITAQSTDKNDAAIFATMLIRQLYIHIIEQIEQYQISDSEYVPIGEEILNLPRNSITFGGDAIPMYSITAEQMCDATDLYITDAFKYAPLILAILCLPKNEPYDADIINRRASKLSQINTDTAIRVLAMLKSLHKYAKEIFPHCYSTSLSQKATGNNRSLTWNDMLMMTANYIPSEIKIISQMNCYDFLRIVNSKNLLNKKLSDA